MIALPAVVGALDVVENVLILAGLGVDDGRFAYPSHLALPITIATIAWTKWVVAGRRLVTVVMALMLAFARRGEPRSTDGPPGTSSPSTGPRAGTSRARRVLLGRRHPGRRVLARRARPSRGGAG